MGTGVWWRVKRWIKNRLFTAFWPVVRSRLFAKLRSLVSRALPPLALCAAAAALGASAASALAVPLGYGALVGAGVMVGALGAVRLFPSSRSITVFRSQRVKLDLAKHHRED